MAHVHRFYVPSCAPAGAEVALPVDEAHHALHVARVRVGDPVVLFDGQGGELRGAVSRTTRQDVFVVVEKTRTSPPPRTRVTLIQAWLNREKSVETLVRRGTELGVACFVFFRGDHSERAPRLNDKWARVAIESCKQCGRLWLPLFEVAPDLRTALDEAPEPLLLATKDLEPVPLSRALAGAPGAVGLIVGPEGDLSGDEIRLARQKGAIPVSLGEATYRTEVAAPLVAALVFYELGELGPR